MKVAGIYLAAGKSQRMGTNKLELLVGKMSLGSLALETALQSSLNKVFIITKEADDVSWIQTDMKGNEKITIVRCSTADEGQSESLRCGVERAQQYGADAVLVILADQPFITVLMIDEIIACMKKTPSCSYVAASHDHLSGPPVLFTARMYPELLNLSGDAGARALLRGENKYIGKRIPCADQRFSFDVDTAEDYEKLLSMTKQTNSASQ